MPVSFIIDYNKSLNHLHYIYLHFISLRKGQSSRVDRSRNFPNLNQEELTPLENENLRRARSNISNRANKNATIMLIFLAFLYIFGNLPYLVYFILTKAFGVQMSQVRTLYKFSQFCINLSVILKLPVFYVCNKPFRLVLRSYLKYFCCIQGEF
jgi:hypothetical protein